MNEITSLDFARAIAGRDEIRLYRGTANALAPAIDWPSRAPSEPYAVHVANLDGQFRTVAIDLDAAKGDPERDAARVQDILVAADLDCVESVSGPSGGRHVLFTVDRWTPSAAVKLLGAELGARIETLDRGPMVSGRGSAIRPPLAPHRLGGMSVPTSDLASALVVLQAGNDVAKVANLLTQLGVERWRVEAVTATRPDRHRLEATLSERVLGVLSGSREKDWGGDTSPSGVLRSLLVAMINAGMAWGEIASLLHDRAEDSVRRKPHRGEALDFLRRQYVDAEKFVRQRPAATGPNDIRIELHHVGEVAGAIRWVGQQAVSELAVLQALLTIGISVGRREVSASVRQLAAATTMHERTVSKALGRLEVKGWLRRTVVGRGALASTFRLADPPVDALAEYHTKHRTGGRMTGVALSGQVLRSTQHDAFRHHKGTWRCFAQLDLVDPSPTRDIAASLGVHPSTARTHLNKLRRWEMAERLPDGWVRLDRDLDDLASERGTLGMVDEQRDRHQAERDRYQESLRPRPRIDPSTGEILRPGEAAA